MTVVAAGRLRHRVTLRRRVDAGTDPDGHPIAGTPTTVSLWGDIVEPRGREFLEARAQLGQSPVFLEIRYRSDGPVLRDELVYDGNTYRIEDVRDPDGRKRKLLLMLTRIEAGG